MEVTNSLIPRKKGKVIVAQASSHSRQAKPNCRLYETLKSKGFTSLLAKCRLYETNLGKRSAVRYGISVTTSFLSTLPSLVEAAFR